MEAVETEGARGGASAERGERQAAGHDEARRHRCDSGRARWAGSGVGGRGSGVGEGGSRLHLGALRGPLRERAPHLRLRVRAAAHAARRGLAQLVHERAAPHRLQVLHPGGRVEPRRERLRLLARRLGLDLRLERRLLQAEARGQGPNSGVGEERVAVVVDKARRQQWRRPGLQLRGHRRRARADAPREVGDLLLRDGRRGLAHDAPPRPVRQLDHPRCVVAPQPQALRSRDRRRV